MRKWTARVVQGSLLMLYAACGAVHAAPQTGWYWNPNESGRGFFVESRDGITFIGAYLYDTDGHALWLVAGGENEDSYHYSGPLYSQSGGQSLFGTYVPPAAPVSVGNITAHFSDDTHATITWPGGVVQVERQIFGTGDPAFTPQVGWWWNPDESGTGYSVEVQGTNLFVVGFMYEDGGRPVWYFSAGPMATETTFHGDVVQFAGGQTMGGPYRPPGAPAPIGTLDIAFTDVDEATFTFTDPKSAVAAPGLKRNETKREQKQFPKPPPAYIGRMQAYAEYSSGGSARWEINIDSVRLDADEEIAPLIGRGSAYFTQKGQMQVTYTANIAGCVGNASVTVPLPDGAIILQVLNNRTYAFGFNFPGFVVMGTLTCDGDTTPFTVPFPGLKNQTPGSAVPIPNQDLAGKHISWAVSKTYKEGAPPVSAGGFWNFQPVWK